MMNVKSGHTINPFKPTKRKSFFSSKLIKCLLFGTLVYFVWFISVVIKIAKTDTSISPSIDVDDRAALRRKISGTSTSRVGEESNKIKRTEKDPTKSHKSKDKRERNAKRMNAAPLPQNNQQSSSGIRLQLSDFQFDKSKVEQAVEALPRRMKTLTAFVEDALNDEIPGARDRGERENRKKGDHGTPPKFTEPMPVRTTNPESLRMFEYPKTDSCHELASKLPVDAGLSVEGKPVLLNTQNRRYDYDVYEDAKFCPVDADAFLPWIHDMFPSSNGEFIHFVAQNKRRCNTGERFEKALERLEPQVALFQAVGVKKLKDDEEAKSLAPEMWVPAVKDNEDDGEKYAEGMPRYRLASAEEADDEGEFTRFICRFHTLEYDATSKKTNDVIVGETLSVFPMNYEYVNLRKRKDGMLTIEGKDNGLFWLSNLRFDCPVPDNGNLRGAIASGESVLDDGTPSIYVDLVPIRTHPRYAYEDAYYTKDMVGPNWFSNTSKRSPVYGTKKEFGFEADKIFGKEHVLPRVEASGRWTNLPICTVPPPPPPAPVVEANEVEDHEIKAQVASLEGDASSQDKEKPYTLTACVWASATFHTRGGDRKVDDTMDRTREWIEYHLMMGFDHIYIYDNTHANSNSTDLIETLSPFSNSEVTRIEWPHIVCNNNIPAHENTGERSSQYAAESSCRQRYGQYTEWMSHFDTDEYFIPMGKYDNLKDVVRDAHKEGTNTLSFRSTRAYPNFNHMEKFSNGGECGKEGDPRCLAKKESATFLETYNCDFLPPPKPDWSDRAKKQIYRPDYVLSHFVHYSTITKGILETYADMQAKGKGWDYWYRESKESERFTDDINEAVMIHSKTTVPGNTKGYGKTCKLGFVPTWKDKCRVGFPIPGNQKIENATTADGYEPNCYTNERVTDKYVPKLRELMHKRTGKFSHGK